MGPEIPDGVRKPADGIHAYADNFTQLDRTQQLLSERASASCPILPCIGGYIASKMATSAVEYEGYHVPSPAGIIWTNSIRGSI